MVGELFRKPRSEHGRLWSGESGIQEETGLNVLMSEDFSEPRNNLQNRR